MRHPDFVIPLISIILPAYNVARYLPETLASLRAQTFADWEAIMVDDGSTDATAQVAGDFTRQDSRIRLLRQKNAGVAAARNLGFQKAAATAQFITFMDADDVYLPHALATLAQALQAQPDMIGAHGLADMIDADSHPLKPGEFADFQRARTGFDGRDLVPWGVDKPTTFETVIHHSRIYPPGLILTRRAALEKAGPFDTAFRYAEDWDMIIRLTRQGPIAFMNEIILHYRRHGENATGHHKRLYPSIRRLHAKTFHAPENTPAQRDLLRGAHRAWERAKMRECQQQARAAFSQGRLAAACKGLCSLPAHAFLLMWGKPL